MTGPRIDKPEPGLYKRRLVRGGPWVTVWIDRFCTCTAADNYDGKRHIWTSECDRFPPLRALVSENRFEDLDEQWTHCAGNRISLSEYLHLNNLKEWAQRHAPDDPFANPSKPANNLSIPSLF